MSHHHNNKLFISVLVSYDKLIGTKMIPLGDKTTLSGFNSLDKGDLLVTKKLLGSYIRRISDELSDCKINISLNNEDENFSVTTEILLENSSFLGTGLNSNLFMALDQAMKQVIEKSNLKQ